MTYLWQLERGSCFYKVQTNDKEVNKKLKRRNGFCLCAFALNSNLWIYDCEFARPDIAKKTMKSVTGKNIKTDSEGVLCYGE